MGPLDVKESMEGIQLTRLGVPTKVVISIATRFSDTNT